MRLPAEKQKVTLGCYYTLSPADKLNVNVSLVIRWYAWPFLMWKAAHKDYDFKWYEYPMLIGTIGKHTILKWMGK